MTQLLYCFPPAGGAPGLFRSWAEQLPAGVAVRVLRYRSPQTGSVADLATAACDDLAAAGEPVAGFFGHSLGALVAFESLRILQRTSGAHPPTLFVAGHVAPHLPSPGPVLHRLPSEEFWQEVAELGGTPPELLDRPDLRAAVEPRIRGEFRIAETYRFARGWPLPCDIVALSGSDDWRAPAAGMAGWRMHTTGQFDLTVVPGGHFFPATNPAETLHQIRAGLAAVTSAG